MTQSNESTGDVDEPKLTYERILNDLSEITVTDSITSSCLHSKFFAIGTKLGRIHIFDHQGNKVNRQELCFHLKSVDCISIDERGEYFASISSDRLVVYGLCDGKPYFNVMPDKPLNVVAIDPYFHKPDAGRRFVTGDDRLVLYERGLLSRHKSTVLQTREQKPVRSVSWFGQFIAWATDTSAQIYDVEQRAIITRIKRDSDIELSSWDDTCQFCWKDKKTLLIGWCNTVKICVIKERSREMINGSQLKELPKKYVEIISMFETEFAISGLAPFNESLLTLSTNYPDNMPTKQSLQFDNESISGLSLTSQQSTSTSITPQARLYNESSMETSKCLSIGSQNYNDFTQEQLRKATSPTVSSVSESNTIDNVSDSDGQVGLSNTNNSNITDITDSNLIRPQLHILDTFPNSYNELSKDILTPNTCPTVQSFLQNQPKLQTSNSNQVISKFKNQTKKFVPYTLLSLHDDGIYFIVCPKDIISARPRDYDDHIDWLVQHSMLKDAYDFAKEYSSELIKYTVRDIESLYKKYLIEQATSESFSEAARLCASICHNNQKAWDDAIKEFCDMGQLNHLLPHLPKKPDIFCLKQDSYNFILRTFLRNDSVSFFRAIKEIPCQLYDLQLMTDQVIQNLANDPKDLVLNEALAELYTCVGNFEDAVNIYLDYNDKNRIFPLIRNNQLVSILRDRVDRLMQIDADETSKLLVENLDYIPMRDIVERLESYKSKRYLVSYLHRLIMRDPDSCIEYHDLMVRLYAQYQPESLLNFLKTSTNYSLEESLIICKENNLIREVVYLLGRMGDLRIALKYIVESQGINEAIEFCKEHQDYEMWQDLIVYSMDKPEFVSALLKNIGTHIEDPIDLIDRIPNGCKIEGLMPALVKILQDYQLQISLEKCCRELMSKDCFSLLDKQIRGQTQGIAVREDQVCDHCGQPLLGGFISDTLSQNRSINSSTDNNNVVIASSSSSSSAANQASTSASARGQLHQVAPSVAASMQGNDLVVFGCHHVFHEECCSINVNNELMAQDLLAQSNDPLDPMDGSKILSCRVCIVDKDDDSIAPTN